MDATGKPAEDPQGGLVQDEDEFVRENYNLVANFVASRTRLADPADIVQTVFERVLRRPLLFRTEHPRAMLLTIARDTVRDYEWKLRRESEMATEWVHDSLVPDDQLLGIESFEDTLLERLQINAMLASLYAREAEVIVAWAAGVPVSEIAEDTGLAPGTVRSILNRARRRLRALMIDALDAVAAPPSEGVPPLPVDPYEWVVGIDTVVARLQQTFEPDAAAQWLVKPHPALAGERPIDALRAGESRRVQGLIDAIAEGVFV